MGNDLKYGLVLGAVVLLIFVGYMAFRHGPKEEPKQVADVNRPAETPPDTDIFAPPSDTFAPTPNATIIIGPSQTTADTVVAVAPPRTPGGQPDATRVTPGDTRTYQTGQDQVTPPPFREGIVVQPPAVETPPKQQTYKIAKGDTLGAISKKFYGTSDKWQKIVDANKDKNLNPNNLVVGTEIVIPEVEKKPSAPAVTRETGGTTETAGGKTHTVVKGDTLYSIAKQYYGDGTKYRKVWEANKDKLPKVDSPLQVGMKLTVP